MKVTVIYSDDASELSPEDYEGRSPDSVVEGVANALKTLGHKVNTLNVLPSSIEQLRKIEFAFNLCDDGFYGLSWMEPHVAALLDVFKVPYTGSSHQTLTVCLNKPYTKRILAYEGLPTAPFYVARKESDVDHDLEYPLIVKPAREGGSIGIKNDAVVTNKKDLKDRISRILKNYRQPALVEKYIRGREFNVAILGNDRPTLLPVSEIVFNGLHKDKSIVSYDAKWKEGSQYYTATVGKCPADIPGKLSKELQDIALKAYKVMEVSGYGRVDIRVGDDGPYILEVNANPDISMDAGLWRSAKAAGMTYEGLIENVLNYGLKKRWAKN